MDHPIDQKASEGYLLCVIYAMWGKHFYHFLKLKGKKSW